MVAKPTRSRDPEHVVFLGAAASRALGYALTKEILPQILRRLDGKARFGDERLDDAGGRRTLRTALRAVIPGYSTEPNQLPPVAPPALSGSGGDSWGWLSSEDQAPHGQ